MEPRDTDQAGDGLEPRELTPPGELTPPDEQPAAAPPVYWQPVERPDLPTGTGAWRGFGSVLRRTFDTFGAELTLFIALSLPAAMLGALSTLGLKNPMVNLVLTIAVFVVGLVTTASSLLAADDLWRGRRPELGDVVRRGLRRVPALFGNYVVIGLAFGGLLLAVFVVLIIVGLASTGGVAVRSNASPAAVLIVAVLFFVAIIATFFVALRWAMSTPAVVIERYGPLDALGRSWRLTRGHAWGLFGLYFMVGVLSILASIGTVLLLLFSTQPAWPALAVGLAALLFSPVAAIMLAIALRDLSGRPDGDIDAALPTPRGRGGIALALLLGGGLVLTVAGFAVGSANDYQLQLNVPTVGRGQLFTGSVQNPVDSCHPLGVDTTFASDEPIYLAAVFDRHVPAGETILISFYRDSVLLFEPVPLDAPAGGFDCYYESEPLVGADPGVYKVEVTLNGDVISSGTFTVE